MSWITIFSSLLLEGKHMFEFMLENEWWKLFSDLKLALINFMEWDILQKLVRNLLFSLNGDSGYWLRSISRPRQEENCMERLSREILKLISDWSILGSLGKDTSLRKVKYLPTPLSWVILGHVKLSLKDLV